MKLQYKPCENGFKAVSGKRELAFITRNGSLNWKTDAEKLPIPICVKIQMFSAGVAHYYGSPDLLLKAQTYCY